jgi:elongation factor P hydroxylase
LASHESLIEYRNERIRDLVKFIEQLKSEFDHRKSVDESNYIPADEEEPEDNTVMAAAVNKSMFEVEHQLESQQISSTRPGSASSSL